MFLSTETIQLVASLLLGVGAGILSLLAFLSWQQVRSLNRLLRTPLAILLNLFAFLFFCAGLATLILSVWINL